MEEREPGNLRDLEIKLEYFFKNKEFLKQALTRTTAITEKVLGASTKDYQKLELIGDAALKLEIAKLIFNKLPESQSVEQFHLIIQPLIANNGPLVQIAKNLDLSRFIKRGRGEINVTDKMYADAMEAILGAISLDDPSGMALSRVIEMLWAPCVTQALQARPTISVAASSSTQQTTRTLACIVPLKPLPIPVEKTAEKSSSTRTTKLSANAQKIFSSLGSTSLKEFENIIKEAEDVNCHNIGRKGNTPLIALLRKKKLYSDKEVEKIKILLKYGASWETKNNQGKSANDIIKGKKISQELIKELKNITPFGKPQQSSQVISIVSAIPASPTAAPTQKSILIEGASTLTNASKPTNLSPRSSRMFGALNRKTPHKQFELYVKAAPDVNRRNVGANGDTPLIHLLRKPSLTDQDILKIETLLKHHALWSASNKKGETAENLAKNHDPKLIERLKGIQPIRK